MNGKPHGTALEALTSEMLGDILRLHDSLEQLKRDVPAMTKQIDTFLSKLEDGLKSPSMERFIKTSISDIYSAARSARQYAKADVESAVTMAVSDGWSAVRTRGEGLFNSATADFVKRIGDAAESAANKAAASIAPLLKELDDEIARLRQQRFRERWVASALACVSAGAIAGVISAVLTLLLLKGLQA